MTEEKGWVEKARPALDPHLFEPMRQAAESIPELLAQAIIHVSGQDGLALSQELQTLMGKTLSSAGIFNLLDGMKPEMVGPTERAWFQKAAELCHHTMNALAGRPLQDKREIAPKELSTLSSTALISFSKLHRAYWQIADAVLPQAEQSK